MKRILSEIGKALLFVIAFLLICAFFIDKSARENRPFLQSIAAIQTGFEKSMETYRKNSLEAGISEEQIDNTEKLMKSNIENVTASIKELKNSSLKFMDIINFIGWLLIVVYIKQNYFPNNNKQIEKP